jgi:hypothetical protein
MRARGGALYAEGVHTQLSLKEDSMSMKTIRTAQQMTVEESATVAATGVARALAAHQAAAVALSSEELSQVNGGLTMINPRTTHGYVPPMEM